MSSDEEDYKTVNPTSHKKLLSEINEIVKFQHIRKPTRSEPAIKNSEFHLVKSKANNDDSETFKSDKKSVSISSIAQTVQKNTKQKEVGNQLKNAFKQANVLSKPLEKVFADKIQRTIAYDSTVTKLGRWDAIVTKNQNAPQLKFPLVLEKTRIKSNDDPEVPQFRYKTKMMKEMEDIRNECFPKPAKPEKPQAQPELLTLEEMRERRRELGRLKIKESHKIAKKRMQGKIKSKKYHKLKKRDELKKKMKEFEELKVSNPEAALKELEKIERQRVRERTTLRHKNTGTWAKNLQVRSKYDANVKQDLEAQLALGRELTQKNDQSGSSDSEDDEDMVKVVMGNKNPWLGSTEPENPLDEIFSGYRKFWDDHNATQKQVKQAKNDLKKPEPDEEEEDSSEEEDQEMESNGDEVGSADDEPQSHSEEEDESENEDSSKFINDLFDEAEEKISSKMNEKLKSLKPKLIEDESASKKSKKSKNKKRKADVRDASYLAFEKKAKLGDIDEGLIEGDGSDDEEDDNRRPTKQIREEIKQKKEEQKLFMRGSTDINPESFLNVKSKHLITAIPISQEFDDIGDDHVTKLSKSNKMSLAEAFENDDIVNDFEQEIEEEDKRNNRIEDTLLPGWGNWGGQGVKVRAPKFMKKTPEVKKKDRIIIRTAPNEKLQKHLISSVPFPFKSVQDFEASMRLPIGRDFIPETAHRKLTMSNVITKVGTVIEPMSEEVLVRNAPLKKDGNGFGGGKNKFMKKGKKTKKVKK